MSLDNNNKDKNKIINIKSFSNYKNRNNFSDIINNNNMINNFEKSLLIHNKSRHISLCMAVII